MAAARALRVLVVDDDADTVESTRILLQLDGHQVQTAYDGVRSIEQAVALQPHVILLDVGMPGMDGYEVARRIQSLALPTAPCLAAVTGHPRQDGSLSEVAVKIDALHDRLVQTRR